ncbi:hypothetical protein [Geomicrobium sp. JCM 19038]|uniref:hypothetical protein n=1 Tax=Geomicrobium sp. JCM 19038 TaxID=1460635 RepID=UPI00045F215A|nr:hypothetical protein [Geomicrobium sp. JCM 19038]GAK10058.1 hypothetical protein JCM19038_3939 [Geomicrobium sp. JCM 19038]
MNKKLLYGALSGVFAVGMLAACGDDTEDPAGEPGDDMNGGDEMAPEDDGMEDDGMDDGMEDDGLEDDLEDDGMEDDGMDDGMEDDGMDDMEDDDDDM